MTTDETPLQRYLRKNAAASAGVPATSGDSVVAPASEPGAEFRGTTGDAGKIVTEGEVTSPRDLVAEEQTARRAVIPASGIKVNPPDIEEKPAGIGARFVALILDQMIFSAVTAPLVFLITMSQVPWQEMLLQRDVLQLVQTFAGLTMLATVIDFVCAFFYYGWFYHHSGATIGKLVVSVNLIDFQSGQKIGYWRAFFRDAILRRYVSLTLTFGIGCLVAYFREDGRALHDLICSTQVVYRRRTGLKS